MDIARCFKCGRPDPVDYTCFQFDDCLGVGRSNVGMNGTGLVCKHCEIPENAHEV